jgi:phospholipid/cholesterol/gamma-HCH transport system ATP-binding protein
LLYPDDGYVKVEGQKVDEMNFKELYKLRGRFGFLFQGSALFDSMTVEENISLPLVESGKRYTLAELNKKVADKLDMVGMEGAQKLKPAELSGGMKKRVGLARALITDPDYIFYDEPTTGLDPIMSDSIDDLIKELTDRLNVTSVVVTHDMYSVKNVANQVAMMHDGKIHFSGTPEELVSTNDATIKEFIQRTE